MRLDPSYDDDAGARTSPGTDSFRVPPLTPEAHAIIRVVVSDNSAETRSSLASRLRATSDIVVVGEAASGKEAIDIVDRYKPDVLVMDFSMPDIEGTAATTMIGVKGEVTRVIAMSTRADEEYRDTIMRAGAAGYFLKSGAQDEVVNAVRAVAHGDIYVGAIPARVVSGSHEAIDPHQKQRDQFARLTHRERDVLLLVGQGFSASEIGAKLFISAKTVDTYKQRVHEKIGLARRSDYVQFVLKLGLLKRDWWR